MYEQITSRSGETVKMLAKLQESKFRKEYGLFLAEGVKLAGESLGRFPVKYALFTPDALEKQPQTAELAQKAEKYGAKVLILSPHVFEKISTENAPQGVIFVLEKDEEKHAQLREGEEETAAKLLLNKNVLALSEIRDPGNLGTILRSAAAFGIQTVILHDCAELWSPKTVRASMGALFRLSTLQVSSLSQLIPALQKTGRRVLATALTNDSLTLGSFPLASSDIPLIGNEGHGLSDELIRISSQTVKIPMAPDTESLNAGIAASIMLWELYRPQK